MCCFSVNVMCKTVMLYVWIFIHVRILDLVLFHLRGTLEWTGKFIPRLVTCIETSRSRRSQNVGQSGGSQKELREVT